MQLYSVKTAAEKLSIHPETLKGYLRAGIIKGLKTGRVWKIEEKDLEAYVHELRAAQDAEKAQVK